MKKHKRSTTLSGLGRVSPPLPQPRITYVVFAYDGPTVETLRLKLAEFQLSRGLMLDLMPDLITVLSRDYYLMQDNGWLIQKIPEEAVT